MYTQWQPGVIAMVDLTAAHSIAPNRSRASTGQAVLRRVSYTDVTLKALNVATTWTDRAQQATTYRKGRVLLAGDAAAESVSRSVLEGNGSLKSYEVERPAYN